MTLPSTAVETAIARCTSRWAMARGHCLNTSIVLAAVHRLSGLFRAVSAVEPSLSRPGKRKDLGSIPLRLSFKTVVVCGHCLVTLSITSY